MQSIDKLAPLREVRVKQRTEPWINDEILEAIQIRNGLYEQFRKNKDDQTWTEYKKRRNEVSRLVGNSKKKTTLMIKFWSIKTTQKSYGRH